MCDLRDVAQVDALKSLIRERADIVVQNLRPGQVEKIGLDAATLTRDKPSLIYCNLGAFGRVGPMKQQPGYDPLMQAFGGIMSTTGEPGRPSVRVGASIVDMGTGMWTVIGVMAALHERQRTGRGRVVDVSLFETATSWVSLLASQFLASGQLAGKQGSGAPGIVPYKGYATSDGEIVVAAGSDALFRALSTAVGRPEWPTNARFKDNPARVAHQADLYAMLDAIIARHTTAHWLQCLEAAGVPCSPVHNLAQMLAHPQTAALGLVQDVPDTGMRFIGLPLSFDGQRPQPRTRPPALGEHTKLLSVRLVAANDEKARR